MSGAGTGVRAADVDGDGLIDLVRADESGMWVVLNNGSGRGNILSSGWVPPCRFVSGGLDQGTRLIDVNGDGLPDVLRSVINADGTTTRAVYMNTGGGWGAPNAGYRLPDWAVFVGYRPFGGMNDFGVRLADVNGDGLPDLLFASADAPDRTWRGVFLNNGQNGWVFDEQWSAALQAPWLPADYFFTMRINAIGNIWISTDSGLRLMDINGDGLADLVFARNGRREVCLNNGRGWNAPGGWAFPVDLVQTRGTEVGDNMVNVVDLDADGYPDIVYYIENRGVAVYLNNRVGGFTNVTGTLSLPEPLGMVRAGWTGPGANDAGTRIFDVNGDGVPDFVRGFRWTDNTTRNSIWLISSQSAPSRKIPNLLRST